VDDGLLEVRLEVHRRTVATCALDGIRGHQIKANILGLGRVLLAAGELHQLGDQRGHFAELFDYVVQKAVEMGASALKPVLTRRTQTSRVNRARMRANAIEAAEQCGILAIPECESPRKLANVLADWDTQRRLIFCDESAEVAGPAEALAKIPRGPVALLIGPEGGFSDEERATLLKKPYVTPLSLGPRILRADTAAVAALALVQSFIGDWR